jgi:periplasmic copper chaperone A
MFNRSTSKLAIFARLVLLLTAGLLGGAANAQNTSILAHDGWLRQPPASLNEAAVYVVIENHTAVARSIVSGTTDIADKVELHEMKMEKMMMRMNQVPKVDLPARGKVSFNPNGLHIMLFGLKKRPVEGDSVIVTLMLDDGTTVPVTATVRKK